MAAQDNMNKQQFYHGTPDERSWGTGGAYGIHVGTHDAAKQALEARIGRPASGEWDGSREYGKTPLVSTGTGVGAHVREGKPLAEHSGSYSSGDPVPHDARPGIFGVAVTGSMSNTPQRPMEDFKANATMKGQLKRGNAKRGYYYSNVGEDEGSVSAVVPSAEHLKRL
jgi:hypothetical protein